MYPDDNLEPEDLGGGGEDMSAFSGERLERYKRSEENRRYSQDRYEELSCIGISEI